MFKRKLLAALVATTAVGFAGYAMNASATDLSATASVVIIAPISILEDTPLNFGTVAPAATVGDTTTVTVAPGGGISSGSTPAAGLGGGEAAGSFTVSGITDATYAVTLPTTDIVFNGMTLNGFLSNNTGTLTGGSDTLTVGATLSIPGGQAAGIYSTNYDVTVEYN